MLNFSTVKRITKFLPQLLTPQLIRVPHRALCLLGTVGVVVCGATSTVFATTHNAEQKPWVVSIRKAHVLNPVDNDEQAIELGRDLYVENCSSCHGKTGGGDGPKAGELEVQSSDFTIPTMWAQTDGELFYKITKGRKPMLGYKRSMTEKERWRVIHYIRSLAPKPEVVPSLFAASSAQRDAISKAIHVYTDVLAVVIKSDTESVPTVGAAMLAAVATLSEIDVSKMPKDVKKSWIDVLKKLNSTTSALLEVGDDVTLRKNFGELSFWVADFVRLFGHAESKPIHLFSTKMSDESTRVWLQIEKAPSNPYGSSSSDTKLLHTLGTQSHLES